MKLIKRTITNFKGVDKLVIEPNGNDLNIYGDNATGKTTIADAGTWLLFGKDSLNRADFEIKPLRPDGSVIHNRVSEVEDVYEIDGTTLTLKRAYSEKWTKKRGNLEQEFDGHTTDYFINTVPVQKKEFDAHIAGICQEQKFRILTNPTYFNTDLDWTKRRTMLLEACGDVSDADVIASNPKLAELPAILETRTTEQHRKLLATRRPELNREIEAIPLRIDEIRRTLGDPNAPKQDLAPLLAQLNQLQTEVVTLESGGKAAELTKELRLAEAAMQEIATRLKAESLARQDAAQGPIRAKQAELQEAESALIRNEGKRDQIGRTLKELHAEREVKVQAIEFEKARTFQWNTIDTCGVCGQPLPADKIEAARAKALEAFNLEVSQNKERIRTAGLAIKAKIDEATPQIETENNIGIQLQQDATRLKNELDTLRAKATSAIDAPQSEVDEFRLTRENKERIESQLASIRETEQTAIFEAKHKVNIVTAVIQEAQQFNAAIDQAATSNTRIAELEHHQKTLAFEFEKICKELFLIEEFIRTKVSLLTDRINSKFKLAQFKLFDVQVNGGLTECCEAMVNGVPFGSLNYGMRLNVGLDIINTFAEHFDFAPTITIDNAESVTSIIPTAGQQIKLIVSATDKTLRFESQHKE